MRLFIAEKPSVAKAIGEVLGVTDKKSGYLVCGESNFNLIKRIFIYEH